MTTEEIKLRQLTGQHLIAPTNPMTVLRDLCGLQAQFLANALHALRIRSGDIPEEETDSLIKSWTIRGTIHVFAPEDLPLFLHRDRTHFLRPCDTLEADEHISKERKRFFADLILDAVAKGVDTRDGLKAICVDNGMADEEALSIFDPWGGTIRVLCEAGLLCHQVREKKAYRLCPPFTPMDKEDARLEMARRYFTHYGPATVKDAAYFFATTQTEVKGWLAKLPVTSTVCDGRTYYYIDNGAISPATLPECIFLAGFDPLMLGYQKTESLYLPPEHLRGIFNLAGIVMPGILLRGRVVGKWKRKDAKLSVTLFEPVCAKDKKRIERSGQALWPELKTIEYT